MSDNYYKTLGIDEKASKEEIKKAFRTLSMKWHPDKNLGNKEESVRMFQKINQAYETLGNEEKREEYDMMNQNPFMRGHNNNSMDAHMEDFLNNIFGSGMFPGMPGMHGMPPGMRSHPSNPFPGIHIFHGGPQMMNSLQKPSPIIKNVMVNIEQIMTSVKIPIDIERWIIENGNKVFEKETIYVDIPQGADENEIIIIRDKGNYVNDTCKGDIKIFVKVTNHTEFKRMGLDLVIDKEITLKDALCGFSIVLKHLNGKSYTLNNSTGSIIKPNYQKVISGMGLERETHKGNLVIQFSIKFPDSLTEEQISKLNEIL
jgi:DnaJ-class molecular chaperone